MPVNPDKLDKTIEAIQKTYSDASISKASKPEKIQRLSTGSLSLDWATGGGIPMGRFTRLWGGQSSGKSLIAWNIIKTAQKKGLLAAYYNIEKQFDTEYVEKLGVDIDKLVLVEGAIIEEVGTKLEALLGAVHVHVLDSCSSAVSIDELNTKTEEWTRGLNARVWGKIFRRALERFDTQDNCVILIDQARDTFNYGGGEHPPGGRLIEHTSSLTLYSKRGAWLYRDKDGYLRPEEKGGTNTMSGMKEPDGFEFQLRVAKSRVGKPLRTARIYYDFDKKSFDQLYEYAQAAIFKNVVKRGGAWYTLPDGTKVQGETGLREAISNDAALKKIIRQKMLS